MRESGILLPIASLPSKYGIGCFSISAYEFIDKLALSGQKYWQILPLGPTSYGDSPYQSFSTFAGNPYFIDLDALVEEGLLTSSECEAFNFGDNQRYVDYEKIYTSRFIILRKAFERFKEEDNEAFNAFKNENNHWLGNYSLFMAIKNHFKDIAWNQWPEDIRLREASAISRYKQELSKDISFYEFLQFEFFKQWLRLKAYANSRGIKIIGDLPIYVAFDSADSWSGSELFQFNDDREPIAVAGCPPDGFSPTGQLWGNPLYDWQYHKKTNYQWWIKRVSHCFKLYDVVRIDHFRGFDEYYSIPANSSTAEHGHWEKGPGYELFKQLKDEMGSLNIIAEDLGYLTESVKELLAQTGFPGMKVLEFAFDSREESDYLPHNYTSNCIVYTGTHDNDTIMGWYNAVDDHDRTFANHYMNIKDDSSETINWDFIRLAHASVAKLSIIPVQDCLGLGSEARINTPSTLGGNWQWRMLDGEFSNELQERIFSITKLYGRI